MDASLEENKVATSGAKDRRGVPNLRVLPKRLTARFREIELEIQRYACPETVHCSIAHST